MESKTFVSPADFTGSDTERIQQAVNAAASGNGIARIFPKEDGTPYMLESAILLPSHVTVFLENCRIKLADSCRDNIFRSANCGLYCGEVAPLEDIHIIGVGNAVVEGADHPRATGDSGKIVGEITYGTDGGKEGVCPKGGWQNIGILLVHVKNFTLENFTVKEPHCWSISLEYCSYGKVRSIQFLATENRVIDGVAMRHLNKDGLDLRRGCHDIIIDTLYGTTGDDILALTALHIYKKRPAGIPESTEMCGVADTLEEEHVYNITIRNIHGYSNGGHQIVRFLTGGGVKMHHITLDGVMDTSAGPNGKIAHATVRFGDQSPVYGEVQMGDMSGFIVTNIHSNTRKGVYICGSLTDSVITNVLNFNPDSEGITYEKSKDEVTRNVKVDPVIHCF